MKKLAVVALIIISSFCLSSCTKTESGDVSKKTLNVAYINTDNLLKKWEKYRDLGDKYIEERNKNIKEMSDIISKKNNFLKEIEGNISEQTDSKKKEWAEIQSQYNTLTNQAKAINADWTKKKNNVVDEIRTIASEVAKEQHFDIVIDNSESSPVIEYGGEDITADILSKIREKEDKKK